MRTGGFSTLAEHMPTAHRFVNDWSPERFIGWANEVGTPCSEVVRRLLERKRHPEQNYRSVLALMSNAKRYGRERLNKACHRALQINSPSRSSIESILRQGLDLVALEQPDETQACLDLDQHENVRGALYYH
jgi:transposase